MHEFLNHNLDTNTRTPFFFTIWNEHKKLNRAEIKWYKFLCTKRWFRNVTFARPCHCDLCKQHLRRITKCCACHDIARGHITKCCACHEKTTRLHWLASKVLRLSRKTRKWPHILWLGSAKTSISCETSSTFHTLKVRIVSQCECTAQWQRINDAPTSRRRVDHAPATHATRTQVQPQTPTINGNPSLRIREKTAMPLTSRLQNNFQQLTQKIHYPSPRLAGLDGAICHLKMRAKSSTGNERST